MNFEQKLDEIVKVISLCSAVQGVSQQKLLIEQVKTLTTEASHLIDESQLTKDEYPFEVLLYGQGKLSESEKRLMWQIGDHMVNGYHPLTHDRDIITVAEMVTIFSAIMPDVNYFKNDGLDFSSNKVARRFGALLARASSPLKKKKSCYYIPAEHRVKGSNYRSQNQNLWILRNHKKYEKLGPSDFYRVYDDQKKKATTVYQEMDKEQRKPTDNPHRIIAVSAPLDQDISFM